ncbi:MAG: glutathione S-transferase N-terminal domain-containing protein [Eggerthellaceae bacterium]|nr:glutathione S-transferase N-terminal domain-containing protein [Eggerthellaceae bacterium]
MTFDNMYLYVLPGCPFCAKVDRFLDAHDIVMEHRSVVEGNNADELAALGGKVQSPCLVVDGEPMYESEDIIEFLSGKIGVPYGGPTLTEGAACPIGKH